MLMIGSMSAFASAQVDQKADSTSTAVSALRHFDARVGLQGLHAFVGRDAQLAEVNELRRLMPDLRAEFDQATGVTRSLWNVGGHLTPPDGRHPEAVAQDFMVSRATLLGLSASDVVDVELSDSVYSPITGVTHLSYRQLLGGIPVYNAQLQFNITRDGRILSINNSFLPSLTAAVATLRPAMDAASAVSYVGAHLGVMGTDPVVELAARGTRQTTELAAPALSTEPVTADLMLLPLERGAARLVWNLQVWTLDGQHAFDFTVDAETGQIWTRFDWVAADSYKVYPHPVESPNHAVPMPPADGRVLVNGPADATASPFGWHDTDGVAGPDFTTTQGNNVQAYTDLDANNLPDTGSSPDCGPGLSCDFPLDLTQAPSAYRAAAVTNLFYWNNIVHDIQYRYGFDEAAGNFQMNNYGHGGAGHDSVQAEAQDGNGFNNANFATPPDGWRPRMQMYLWNAPTPDLGGDLDAGIIVHEYGHGISNRLVGGPSIVSCLTNQQQPGEGISDWLSLVYTARATDTATLARGIGTYALNQPTTGPGIRPQRYSTDPAMNTWTYASISSGTLSVPHGVGAVWAQGMWEVYWALVDHYGFDPNLANAAGGAGNQRAMLYHNEGLKFASCNPGFTQLRDGIIQAAQTIDGGADVCRLWSAFAGFGLGANAVNPSVVSISGIVDGFDVPALCGGSSNPNVTIDDVSLAEGDEGMTTATFTVSLESTSSSPTILSYTTADGTTTSHSNRTRMLIPTAGAAIQYPSEITVAGGPTISALSVRLDLLQHTWPDDLDVLLVGPGGQRVMLMSDVGGSADVSDASIVIAGGAGSFPDAGPLASGTYAPTDVEPGDALPTPAPAGPYGTDLTVFDGTSANGIWRLYVADDAGGDTGYLAGWSLVVTPASGPDYEPTSGQLVFSPGSTSQTVSVTVNGDTTGEADEVFFVNLSNPINATIVDGQGQATIVNDDSGAPTTVADTFSTPFSMPLAIAAPGVLANDSGNGGGATTARLESTTSHGSLELNANGSFAYVPNAGYVGADSFSYRAVNGMGPGNVATVTLTVHPGIPTSVGDNYATPFDAPLVLTAPGVLGNDTSNNGTMRAELMSSPSSGAVSLDVNGGFTYTPNAGFSGADRFTYRAVNGVGPGNVATVIVSVQNPATVQAPRNLRVDSVVGTLVTLRWDVPDIGPQPTFFVLDGGLNRGEALGSLATDGNAPVFTFAAPTGSFFIRVHGQLGAHKSPASNEVPVHVDVPVVPSAPAQLTGLVNGSSLALAWNNTYGGGPPSGLVLDVTGSLTTSLPLGLGESFEFTGVPAGTYTLSLRAANRGGAGAASNAVTLTFPGPCSGVPEPPTNFAGYAIGSTVFVLWDAPASGPAATAYQVNVTGALVGSFTTPGRSTSGVVGPGTYGLSVQSTNACGTSAPTSVQVVTVP